MNDIGLSTDIYAPVLDWRIGLSFGFYVLLFLIIAGSANGANLTDGIDGLAVGVGMIALITFTAMNVVTWIRSSTSTELRDASALDLALVGAALTGGAIGFLWYNAFPAEVFMGDTGSMAIGGAIGAFAVMTKTELLLLLIGGIFVFEALSVILQVFSFRYWGRRLFLMAPIHHHFAMKAWSETKIMVRFWILGRDPVRRRRSPSTTATTSTSERFVDPTPEDFAAGRCKVLKWRFPNVYWF